MSTSLGYVDITVITLPVIVISVNLLMLRKELEFGLDLAETSRNSFERHHVLVTASTFCMVPVGKLHQEWLIPT